MGLGPTAELAFARRDAWRWFMLAIGSIAVAGAFALYLAIARIPGLEQALAPDPKFGWRGLIVHVNLALGVWFGAFTAGLFCLLPGARRLRVTQTAQMLALLGVLVFSSTLFIREAEPIRSNYIPTLDHWVFLLGLGLFGGSVGLSYLDRRLLPDGAHSDIPADAQAGLRAAALATLTALATFAMAWLTQPANMLPEGYYHRLFWGGGHVLQFANVLAMVSCWLLLLGKVTRRPVLHGRFGAVLFALLLLPALAGPWLMLAETSDAWFTQMMRWGIWPVTSVLILLCARALLSARPALAPGALRSTAFVGFATSVAMTIAGFILGAMIRDDSTLVPGHYHMSIGAVTAAFMATFLVLLEPQGRTQPDARPRRLAVWQPLLFGGGQAVMALGFAIAGVAGAERKAYGSDQQVRSVGEWIGLSVMGGGAVLASVGGIVFLVLAYRALRTRVDSAAA
ncbi:MAG: cbb3-type cytochrome c oxidase subunit I [Planctomycetes bacterium]|nr:cbb3-type cytochrome c oxidase subunit I [Planctomycetota bacterium]MCW8135970.1 cbb3-type cytochrome c oxidase subunit I [Planctomycetota bacterium]